jgi:hypothetical protein
MREVTFAFKDLTALLTAQWWILRLAWVSCTPPLSLWCAEAVTYRILKECRNCIFKPDFQERQRGGSSCENNKIWNKSFPASRNVTVSHCLCLLPVTGNYISELIILILKSSAWQRCSYSLMLSNHIESFFNGLNQIQFYIEIGG